MRASTTIRFFGVPNSGGALQMFQAVLEQKRRDGTPHITNNSYGFMGVPNAGASPNHEIHDINHPLHRKVGEVIAAGVVFMDSRQLRAKLPKYRLSPVGSRDQANLFMPQTA